MIYFIINSIYRIRDIFHIIEAGARQNVANYIKYNDNEPAVKSTSLIRYKKHSANHSFDEVKKYDESSGKFSLATH